MISRHSGFISSITAAPEYCQYGRSAWCPAFNNGYWSDLGDDLNRECEIQGILGKFRVAIRSKGWYTI